MSNELTTEEKLEIRSAQYEYLSLMQHYQASQKQVDELTARINTIAVSTQKRQQELEQKYAGKLDLVTLQLSQDLQSQ